MTAPQTVADVQTEQFVQIEPGAFVYASDFRRDPEGCRAACQEAALRAAATSARQGETK